MERQDVGRTGVEELTDPRGRKAGNLEKEVAEKKAENSKPGLQGLATFRHPLASEYPVGFDP